MKRLITLTILACIIMTVQVRAEINYPLLYEWSRQPSNVQQNLVLQNTNIRVVDDIAYYDPTLDEVYGLTTMQVIPATGYVTGIDVQIQKGSEYALTHEVGHCLSNCCRIVYWWCFRPEFIKIWQEERDNCALLLYGHDDIREYFACAYDLYIRFPEILKKTCPSTFNYIKVVLTYT